MYQQKCRGKRVKQRSEDEDEERANEIASFRIRLLKHDIMRTFVNAHFSRAKRNIKSLMRNYITLVVAFNGACDVGDTRNACLISEKSHDLQH